MLINEPVLFQNHIDRLLEAQNAERSIGPPSEGGAEPLERCLRLAVPLELFS
jgi:hypothetical protein